MLEDFFVQAGRQVHETGGFLFKFMLVRIAISDEAPRTRPHLACVRVTRTALGPKFRMTSSTASVPPSRVRNE